MDVIEAILTRHSVRDFSSKPVAKETVMKILEAATRSPSSGNGQPWEVFVASGATIEKIRQIYQERAQGGAGGPTGGACVRFTSLEHHGARRERVRAGRTVRS